MIMVDPLAELVEQATKEVNPHIFTIATLTGHAFLAMGDGYSVPFALLPFSPLEIIWKIKKKIGNFPIRYLFPFENFKEN